MVRRVHGACTCVPTSAACVACTAPCKAHALSASLVSGWAECRYFPFVNDAETLPQCTNEFIKQAQKEAFATQQPPATQRPQTQGDFAGDVVDLCDEDEEPAAIEPHPTFEVFWQVRVPPSLVPNIQAINSDTILIFLSSRSCG